MLSIFLDQNHWIYLCRAHLGRPTPKASADLVDLLRSLVNSSKIRLPLSTTHLVELLLAESGERRHALADFIEELSAGWFFASWTDVMRSELTQALAVEFPRLSPISPVVIGRGFMFGLSLRDRALLLERWSAAEIDAFACLSRMPGELIALLKEVPEPNRLAQKKAILALGSKNSDVAEHNRNLVRREGLELSRRVALARHALQLQDEISAVLGPVGRSFGELVALGPDRMQIVLNAVASLFVDRELTLYRDRQWTRRIKSNDYRDLGQLALALPYCDIVVTERLWMRGCQEMQLRKRFPTTVLCDVGHLVPHLNGL